MKHFILTRFNLKLWPRNKFGELFDHDLWLEERMLIFEQFCLPSIVAQSCNDFEWLILMDEGTPQWCRDRMGQIRVMCPQITPVYVPRGRSRMYASVFCEEVRKRSMNEDRVITTYLDNDDAVSRDFIREVKDIGASASDNTVISFTRGFQFFKDARFATLVRYPNNHFVSLVEASSTCRTIYGYGSHFSLDKVGCLKKLGVNKPMWVEVIHSNNVDNDVKMTLHTKLFSDESFLTETFGVAFSLDDNFRRIFITRWIPMALRHSLIRVRQRLFGHDWWK